MSSAPPTIQLTSLVDFVSQTAAQEDAVFSLRDEALAAKHSITFFNPIIDKHIKKINVLLAKEGLTKQEQEKLATLQTNLLSLSERLNEALKKVAVIVKSATEIEVIKTSKLDAVQLLGALRQVPRLIGSLIEVLIQDIVQNIEECVSKHVDDKTYLAIIKECEYFGNTATINITRAANETMEKISARLDTVNVARIDKSEDGGSAGAVDENRVEQMLKTVP